MGVWDKDAYERWLRAKNSTDEEFGMDKCVCAKNRVTWCKPFFCR